LGLAGPDPTPAALLTRRLPLELKTGKRPPSGGSSPEHRAQMALYALLIGERYGHVACGPSRVGSSDAADVGGVLVYLSSAEEGAKVVQAAAAAATAAAAGRAGGAGPAAPGVIQRTGSRVAEAVPVLHHTMTVPALWNEQRSLIICRNLLAEALTKAKSAAAKLPAAKEELSAAAACGSFASGNAEVTITATQLAHRDTVDPALPAMLQEQRMCARCYMFAACAAVYACRELPHAEAVAAAKAADIADGAIAAEAALSTGIPQLHELQPGVKGLYTAALEHITPAARTYVHRWLRLVDLEAAAALGRSGSGGAPVKSKVAAPINVNASANAGSTPAPAADIEDIVSAPAPASVKTLKGSSSRVQGRAVFWNLTASQREADGRGAANMVLIGQEVVVHKAPSAAAAAAPVAADHDDTDDVGDDVKDALSQAADRAAASESLLEADTIESISALQRQNIATAYDYTFVTLEVHSAGSSRASSPSAGRNLFELDIGVGDVVVASGSARGPYGLISGYVVSKTAQQVVVRGERDVAAAFPGTIAPVASPSNAAGPRSASAGQWQKPWLWRLDKDEFEASTRVVKDNLIRLIMGSTVDWDDLDEEAADDDVDMDKPPAPAAAAAQRSVVMVDGVEVDLSIFADDVPAVGPAAAAGALTQPAAQSGGGQRGDIKRQRLLIELLAPRFFAEARFPWSGDGSAGFPLPRKVSLIGFLFC
jgi:hypothetical protein